MIRANRHFPALLNFASAAAACHLLVLSLTAQPAPTLTAISREWLQRGTAPEITLSGEQLAGATRVLVEGPGIHAEIVPPPSAAPRIESSDRGISSVAPADEKQLRVRLQIDPSAALTERELRVVTANGVSNPLTVRLSHLPQVDASANQSREKAQVLTLPVAVQGIISSSAQSHFYRFAARKDQRLIFDVHASRLGSRLDSSLAILDLEGRELARNEDAAGLDSVLEFNPPADGEFIAELRDFRYQGGGDYTYRLIAGMLPHVFSAFPYGGGRGETIEVRLKGANLENASRMLLNLAGDAPLGRQEIRASTQLGLSNAFPFDVSDLPSISESEPNSAIDQADLITLPIAINGRIDPPRDYDAFRFTAEKDQRVIFEVHAFRFGSPLDAVLILTGDTGSVLQRNDDAIGSDARIDYTFKEAGEYHVIVEDLLNRGGGEFGYRLTATIPRPDFALVIPRDTFPLRQGGRVPIRCELSRMNGFREPVRIVCEGLPPGVFAEPLLLGPDSGSGLLVLSAALNAEISSVPLRIRAVSGQESREAQVFAGERRVKAGYLSVLPPAPFSISPVTIMSTIEQNQTGQIEFLVERQPGFDAEIKVTAEGFSSGRDPITRSFELQPAVVKSGEKRGVLALKAKTDSEIGARPIVLKAEAENNGHVLTSYSTLVPIATASIPFVLTTTLKRLVVTALPSDSGSAASEAIFSVKAQRRMGFDGAIGLKLEGLPEGVHLAGTAEKISIPAKETEVAIKLVATDKAPAGKDLQLTISGSGMHQDRLYRFSPPAVTLTINAPETANTEPTLANTTP